jgi:HSP20 family protein
MRRRRFGAERRAVPRGNARPCSRANRRARVRSRNDFRPQASVARRLLRYLRRDDARSAGFHPIRRRGASRPCTRREIAMTLIRWNPARPLRTLAVQDEMDRLIEGFLGHPSGSPAAPLTMPVDIEETPEAYVFRADLPGFSQKDVKVSLAGDTLTLRAERKRETESTKGSVHRSERIYGTFERTFTLADPVRGDQVKAAYKDGVLEIRVPKAEEARVREIEVQVG